MLNKFYIQWYVKITIKTTSYILIFLLGIITQHFMTWSKNIIPTGPEFLCVVLVLWVNYCYFYSTFSHFPKLHGINNGKLIPIFGNLLKVYFWNATVWSLKHLRWSLSITDHRCTKGKSRKRRRWREATGIWDVVTKWIENKTEADNF